MRPILLKLDNSHQGSISIRFDFDQLPKNKVMVI